MPEATQGLPYVPGPTGMPAPAFWGGASHGTDVQEFPNPAYRAGGLARLRFVESISLDASAGLHDGAQEASGAAAGGGSDHAPAAPAGYPLDLSPLLEAILQMCDSQLEFQQMMLENESTSSRMHTVVEDAPPSTHPALLHMATPSNRPSMPSEDPEGPCLHPILPLPPLHISYAMLPVANRSPFAMPDGCWELGLDIQAAMVKLVGTMVTKLPDVATYAKSKPWLLAVED